MTHTAEPLPNFFQPYSPEASLPKEARLSGPERSYLEDMASSIDSTLQDVEALAGTLPQEADGAGLLTEQLDPTAVSVGRHMDNRARVTWKYMLPVEAGDELWLGSGLQICTAVTASSAQEVERESEMGEAISLLTRDQYDVDFWNHVPTPSEYPVILGQHGEPTRGGFSYEAPAQILGLREQIATRLLKETGALQTEIIIAAPFNSSYDRQLVLTKFDTPLSDESQGKISAEEASIRRRILAALILKSSPLARW